MKRIPGMKTTRLARNIAALLLSAASFIPLASAQVGGPTVRTSGNVSYVSGGIGLDAIAQLESMAGQFNLKLVFALRSGEWLSDVRVTIADAGGRTLLDTTSDGPWLMARLPAGNYQVTASYAGRAERRGTGVGAGLRTLDFRWASD